MADLFVLNPTTQDAGFNWREPESPRIFSIAIPAGHQVHVLKDVADHIVISVIDQHRKYGMMSADEARKAQADSMVKVSLIYSDKPLPAETYEMVDEINEDVVARQIQLEKERTAIATMNAVAGNPLLNEGVKAVEVEITEMTPKEPTRKDKPLVKQKFSSQD